MTATETEIIKGLRKQSPTAQQQLLELYGSSVWTQVVRLIPQVQDAEEVYQDIFIKVFENIMLYNEARASLKTWISRIAYNESVSFLRRSHQDLIYLEDNERKAESISETEIEKILGKPDEEVVQLLQTAIRHLQPDEQAIITMFYYDEMSLKEIAEITDSIPMTIASKLCRTRKKLCKIIKDIKS